MLPGKKLTPAAVLQIVRRRAWLIIVPPIVALFAALVYSSTIPNVYQSDMLIAIDPQRVPDAFVKSTVTLRTALRMQAISVQVMSRTNLERMIGELDLYPKERQRLPMEDIVVQMRKDIGEVELEHTRNESGMDSTSAFHVRFTYPDPNMAARVAQQLGTLFVQQNAKDRDALAQATNTFLQNQLGEARQRLETQERRLEEFRQIHGKELPTQMQANLQAVQNTQMQIQGLVESLARDRDRRMMLDRMSRDAANEPVAAAPSSQPGTTATPVTASAQQQLAVARATLANYELRLKPEHPDVVRIKRVIAGLEPKAAAEAASGTVAAGLPLTPAEATKRDKLAQMAAEIESLDRQIGFKESEQARLRREVSDYQHRIEAVPGLESEWVALTRDYETQQNAYKELLANSQNAKVAVDLEEQQIGEHFRIVDSARVPVRPLQSIRPQINAGGLLLGLVFGLGLVALLEIRDTSFRSDADVLEVLALPVLACVPFIETASEQARRRRRTVLLSAAGAACFVGVCYVTFALKLWRSIV